MDKKEDFKQKPNISTTGFPGRGGPMGAIGTGARANDFKGSLLKLSTYLVAYKFRLIFVFLFAIISTVFTIASPKLLGNITNEIVDDFINITVYNKVHEKLPPGTELPSGTTGKEYLATLPKEAMDQIPVEQLERINNLDLTVTPTIDFESIGRIILFLIGLYIFSAVFSYLQSWIMTRIAQMVTFKLREQVFEKINLLPLSYFDTNSKGDILSRITNDIDTINQTLNQSLTQIVTAMATIVGIVIMMLSISPLLTVVAILILPISFVFVTIVVKRSQKLFVAQQKTLGEINGHIEETYSAHNIVRAYNGEEEAVEKFEIINAELYDSGWKSQFLSGLLMPIMGFIGNLGYVAIAT